MNFKDWTAIETDVSENKEAIIGKLVEFALSDTLLFWSTDKNVHGVQEQKWAPIISWVNQTIRGDFKKTSGLDTLDENNDMSDKLKIYLSNLSDKELSVFYVAALTMRSVLLALALVKGKINANEAFELSELETLYQIQKWGVDDTIEARHSNIKQILINAEEHLHV